MEWTPWERLQKEMLWHQLEFLHGCKILDFGSGHGTTASHLAKNNTVVAIEPNPDMPASPINNTGCTQIIGGAEQLAQFADGDFDAVICHNVLEYVADKAAVVRALTRLIKPGGIFSLCKNNRNGRIMQMTVLLNNFEHAHELLDGKDGYAAQFGAIGYYDSNDVEKWEKCLMLEKRYGICTFWDLQQNQAIQKEASWQREMLRIEQRVSVLKDFQSIAKFHHLIYRKQ